MSAPSEPSSPQSSTRTRSPSPEDVLERVAADVKEYERENVDTFEASVKAKHNLMTVEQNNGESVTVLFQPCFSLNLQPCYFLRREVIWGWGWDGGLGMLLLQQTAEDGRALGASVTAPREQA